MYVLEKQRQTAPWDSPYILERLFKKAFTSDWFTDLSIASDWCQLN